MEKVWSLFEFIFGFAVFKDDGINGDIFRRFLGWVYNGVLASRGIKARVGMCIGFFVIWRRKYKYF